MHYVTCKVNMQAKPENSDPSFLRIIWISNAGILYLLEPQLKCLLMNYRAIDEAGGIAIEGVLSGSNSYIALDDIKFTKGACPSASTSTSQISDVTTSSQLPVSTTLLSTPCPSNFRLPPRSCDYDTNRGCRDLYGNWNVTSGAVANVGPQVDHTTGTTAGQYIMLSNTAEPRWLTLHRAMTGIPCDICLSFYYSIQIGPLGALGIFWQSYEEFRTSNGTLIGFDIDSNPPYTWEHYMLTIRLV